MSLDFSVPSFCLCLAKILTCKNYRLLRSLAVTRLSDGSARGSGFATLADLLLAPLDFDVIKGPVGHLVGSLNGMKCLMIFLEQASSF